MIAFIADETDAFDAPLSTGSYCQAFESALTMANAQA
jgi:hypothetical protein